MYVIKIKAEIFSFPNSIGTFYLCKDRNSEYYLSTHILEAYTFLKGDYLYDYFIEKNIYLNNICEKIEKRQLNLKIDLKSIQIFELIEKEINAKEETKCLSQESLNDSLYLLW